MGRFCARTPITLSSHEGLLDAKDDQTFDAVLASLEPEWNKKERELLTEGHDPKFFNWMSKKAAMMKESLTSGVRLKAGLQPGEKMTSNAAEAGNHVLKEAADYEEMIVTTRICSPSQICSIKPTPRACASHTEEGTIPF